MKGRPPKPTRLKVLSGETRPSRLKSEPQPAERTPEPPAWLSEPQRAAWDRVTAELEAMGQLFAADTDTIVCYASSVALLAEAEKALALEGRMYEGRDGGRHRNPWLLVRRDAMDGINRYGSLLGLSPVARTHLGVSMRARTPEDELAGRLLS